MTAQYLKDRVQCKERQPPIPYRNHFVGYRVFLYQGCPSPSVSDKTNLLSASPCEPPRTLASPLERGCNSMHRCTLKLSVRCVPHTHTPAPEAAQAGGRGRTQGWHCRSPCPPRDTHCPTAPSPPGGVCLSQPRGHSQRGWAPCPPAPGNTHGDRVLPTPRAGDARGHRVPPGDARDSASPAAGSPLPFPGQPHGADRSAPLSASRNLPGLPRRRREGMEGGAQVPRPRERGGSHRGSAPAAADSSAPAAPAPGSARPHRALPRPHRDLPRTGHGRGMASRQPGQLQCCRAGTLRAPSFPCTLLPTRHSAQAPSSPTAQPH